MTALLSKPPNKYLLIEPRYFAVRSITG
jgi:hypothetical protein